MDSDAENSSAKPSESITNRSLNVELVESLTRTTKPTSTTTVNNNAINLDRSPTAEHLHSAAQQLDDLTSRDLKQEAGEEDDHEDAAADAELDAEMESPDLAIENAKTQT